MPPAYWLMKSEPDVFSIDDLEKKGVSGWDGVRNYQARNYMKTMKKGDQVFFLSLQHRAAGHRGLRGGRQGSLS